MVVDITGKVFGRLRVLSFSHLENAKSYWNCACECGKTEIVQGKAMKSGDKKSCGCMWSRKTVAPLKVGEKFGRWTIISEPFIERQKSGHTASFYNCKCDCGTVQIQGKSNLIYRRSQSCGCMVADSANEHREKYVKTRLARILNGIVQRCLNPNSRFYRRYGGRGIKVCDRWIGPDGLKNFAVDMGVPKPHETIDRRNNDGPYSPENCRWASRKQQSNNTSVNIRITIEGATKTISEWADLSGVLRHTIDSRLRSGITGVDLIAKKLKRRSREVMEHSPFAKGVA